MEGSEDMLFEEIDDIVVHTEYEKEEILNRLSDELLIDNLNKQLEALIIDTTTPTNFLEIFENRFNFLASKFTDNDEVLSWLSSYKMEFFTDIHNKLATKFDISFNFDLEYMPLVNYYFYIRKAYEFFILNYRENICQLFLNYIDSNKSEIVKKYKPEINRRDLGFSSIRRRVKHLDDAIILYSIEDIMRDAMSLVTMGEDIIELIILSDEDEYVNHTMKELFIDMIHDSLLGGEFSSKFYKPLEDEIYFREIYNSVRYEYLKSVLKK